MKMIERRELTLSTVLQDADPLTDVPQIQRRLVVTTHVLPDLSYAQMTKQTCYNLITSSLISSSNTHFTLLTNLHHLAELGQVTSDEVEEGELVKVLGSLVAHFDHLVVSLQQRRLAQTLPAAALIQGLGRLQRHLESRREREKVRDLCSLMCREQLGFIFSSP